jgi:hypothetical protein
MAWRLKVQEFNGSRSELKLVQNVQVVQSLRSSRRNGVVAIAEILPREDDRSVMEV